MALYNNINCVKLYCIKENIYLHIIMLHCCLLVTVICLASVILLLGDISVKSYIMEFNKLHFKLIVIIMLDISKVLSEN